MTSKHPLSALTAMRWEDDLLEFVLIGADCQISCSISREALEDAGPGRRASRWQLLDVFERLRVKIERIVLAKKEKAKASSFAAIHVSTDDLNSPPDAPSVPVVKRRDRQAA